MTQENQNLPAGASSSKTIASLEAEMEAFKKEQKEVVARIQQLMQDEDPANGVFFAQEIFQARQDKLRLDVEIDIRRKGINRILAFGEDAQDAPPPSAGFIL